MNDLHIFDNKDFGTVRTLTIKGEPWFVGIDIATALGYAKPYNAMSTHVEQCDTLKQGIIDSVGREQQTTLINESGMYALIFGSKLQTAKNFKHWVTSEVLPTIRKQGSYNLPTTYKQALQQLIIQVEENEKLQLENKEMKPKADYFDELVDRNLLTSFRDTAKEFQIKESVFIKWLIDNNYIYRDSKKKIRPYATSMNKGLFELKEFSSRYSNHADAQTLITPKGRETFRLLLCKGE